MSKAQEAPASVQARGSVTSDETIQLINATAATRTDLPDDFFKLPVQERLSILGLDPDPKGN